MSLLYRIPGWAYVICVIGPVAFLIAQAIRPKKGPE